MEFHIGSILFVLVTALFNLQICYCSGDTYFYYVQDKLSWMDAQQYCISQFEGNLLNYFDADLRILANHVTNGQTFWAGYHAALSAWVSNEGCFQSNTILNGSRQHFSLEIHNAATCQHKCLNYTAFALMGNHCYCLDGVPDNQFSVSEGQCNITCKNTSFFEPCGGSNVFNVYSKSIYQDNTTVTTYRCISIMCSSSERNNKSLRYHLGDCSEKHPPLCRYNRTDNKLLVLTGNSNWVNAAMRCRNISHSYLASSVRKDCNYGYQDIFSNKYWIGVFRAPYSVFASGTADISGNLINCPISYFRNATLRHLNNKYCQNLHPFICSSDSYIIPRNPNVTVVNTTSLLVPTALPALSSRVVTTAGHANTQTPTSESTISHRITSEYQISSEDTTPIASSIVTTATQETTSGVILTTEAQETTSGVMTTSKTHETPRVSSPRLFTSVSFVTESALTASYVRSSIITPLQSTVHSTPVTNSYKPPTTVPSQKTPKKFMTSSSPTRGSTTTTVKSTPQIQQTTHKTTVPTLLTTPASQMSGTQTQGNSFPMAAIGGGAGTLVVLVVAVIVYLVIRRARNRNTSHGKQVKGRNMEFDAMNSDNTDPVSRVNPMYGISNGSGPTVYHNEIYSDDTSLPKEESNYAGNSKEANEASPHLTHYPDTYRHHSVV